MSAGDGIRKVAGGLERQRQAVLSRAREDTRKRSIAAAMRATRRRGGKAVGVSRAIR